LKLTNSVLEDVRETVGLTRDTSDFDGELLLHINSSLVILRQNGIGSIVSIEDTTTTWSDVQDPLQIEGNKFFDLVPLFINLNVKMLFDSPPPSTIEYYSKTIDQTLWRLKVAYEDFTIPTVILDDY